MAGSAAGVEGGAVRTAVGRAVRSVSPGAGIEAVCTGVAQGGAGWGVRTENSNRLPCN